MSTDVGHTEFREYYVPASGEPLGQGDLLEAADPAASMWQRRLLVLTADCDLAHGKHQGRVTCVPVLDSADYLLEFQLPAMRKSFTKKPIAEIQEALGKAGYPGISNERLVDWIVEAATEEILSVASMDASDRRPLEFQIDALRLLCKGHPSLEAAITAYANAITMTGLVGSRDEALNRVKSDLRGRLKNLPGDSMFLSAVSPRNEEGYFIYFRHIEQLWEPQIAISPTKMRVTHRRLARLTPRFADAAAQQFGMVFMSIGLPTEYEDGRREHTERVGEGIG